MGASGSCSCGSHSKPRFIRGCFVVPVRSRPAQTELISCLLPDVTVSWPQILHSPIFGNNSLGVPDSILLFVHFYILVATQIYTSASPHCERARLILLCTASRPNTMQEMHCRANAMCARPTPTMRGRNRNPGRATKLPVRPRSMQPRLGRPQVSVSAQPRPRTARSINGALDARRDVVLALSFRRQDGLSNWLVLNPSTGS